MSYNMTDYKNTDFFSKIDTQEKAYWLGFIYADGNISRDRDLFQIHLQRRDNEHLKKIGNIFNKHIYEKDYYKPNGKKYGYAILSIFNKEVKNSLLKCGIFPNKTKLDDIYIFNKIEDKFIQHFIRGVFDGDGSISEFKLKNGKVNYCLNIAGSQNFIKKIKKILINKLGIANTKTSDIKGCKVIRWSGLEQIKIIY